MPTRNKKHRYNQIKPFSVQYLYYITILWNQAICRAIFVYHVYVYVNTHLPTADRSLQIGDFTCAHVHEHHAVIRQIRCQYHLGISLVTVTEDFFPIRFFDVTGLCNVSDPDSRKIISNSKLMERSRSTSITTPQSHNTDIFTFL